MIYLLLCILANLLIFVVFRLYPKLKIDTFQAIVMNYFFCVITGLLFDLKTITSFTHNLDSLPSWSYIALFLSIVFILSFALMARTTQLLGITVATIASKLSLVIPVSFSLLVFSRGAASFTWPNYLGLLLALVAIVCASLKKTDTKAKNFWSDGKAMFLPFSVFLLGGMLDTIINYANISYIQTGEEPVFVTSIFILAFGWGLAWLIQKGEKFQIKSILGGFLLGLPNYFSMIFLLKSLEAFDNLGAFVYPLINIGIIIGGALISLTIFRDRLLPINYLGVFLALVALIFISWENG